MTDKAILHLDGQDITVDEHDGETIKRELVTWLGRSTYEDRAALTTKTAGAMVFVDPDGLLRIGIWLLEARGKDPILRYREPATALGIKAHVVTLDQHPWHVRDVKTEKIMPRR